MNQLINDIKFYQEARNNEEFLQYIKAVKELENIGSSITQQMLKLDITEVEYEPGKIVKLEVVQRKPQEAKEILVKKFIDLNK